MDCFSLDILNEDLMDESFKEFCNAIDELNKYTKMNDLYMEALDDPKLTGKNFFDTTRKNTIELTKQSGHVIGQAIDAEASVYNTGAKLLITVARIVVKVITFFTKKVNAILKFINRGINNIDKIPERVAAKIRGDITLYIAAGDIEAIYNSSIISDLDNYVLLASELLNGESWQVLRRGLIKKAKTIFTGDDGSNKNDKKLCKEMNAIAFRLQTINFTKTIIKLKDEKTRNTYFGNDRIIKFKDMKGQSRSFTYLEALKQIIDDLNEKKDAINSLQTQFGEKMDATKINQTWVHINTKTQELIKTTFSNMASVISIIGKLVKYVIIDVKTIDNSVKKVLKIEEKQNKEKAENPVKNNQ